jgi:hypothetical protein
MSVLIRPASIVLTCAAVAAAAGLAATPASAATKTSWAITRGGAVTATTKSFTVEDITKKAGLTCGSSTVKGKLKSGKFLSGTNAGTVTSATVGSCSLDEIPVTITPGHLPWHLNLVSYNAAKGLTTATLTGIHMSLTTGPEIGCSAVLDGTGKAADDGTLDVIYNNKTGKLTTHTAGSRLRLFGVTNCEGVVSNGDAIALIANYVVSPKQKITRS